MRKLRDDYYFDMLAMVASRATCPRRAIAAIIVDELGCILSTGYNGVPRGVKHCTEETPCEGIHDPSGDTSRCMAVHAEINALLQCLDRRYAFTMYISSSPCFVCAKTILNTAIQRVGFLERYSDTRGHKLLLDHGIACFTRHGSLIVPDYGE